MSPRPPRLATIATIATLLLSLATSIATAGGGVKVYRAHEVVDPLEVVRILEGSPPRPSAGMPAARATDAEDPHAVRTRSLRLFDDPSAPPLAAKMRPAPAATPAAQGRTETVSQARVEAVPQARAEAASQAQPDATPRARADGAAPPRAHADAPSARADVEVDATASGDITRRDPQRAGGGASVLSLPVQFAFDSAEILAAARAQLDALAEGVRMLPTTTRVVIEGHTDAAGRDDYNQQLSLRRAQSVKRYLVMAHGVEPERLRAVGLGEHAPLVGLAPTAAENRRVQFRGER